MKIYLNDLNESWVVDRLKKNWTEFNTKLTTNNIKEADIIWIIAPWLWKNVPKKHLAGKKVICSIYHIDFEKFDEKDEKDFIKRDKYVDQYHVISLRTKEDLQKLTRKKIISLPFWVDQRIYKELNNTDILRNSLGFSTEDYLIGSFQRDTEGSDLKTPKLIKGPDIFLKIVKNAFELNPSVKIVLAGKRRHYLINNLQKNKIPFFYYEMATSEEINTLYNILDLYIVSSRLEGGPQAIVECAITKTPIISTDVGVAAEILNKSSIYKNETNYHTAVPDTKFAYENALKLIIPDGMEPFRKMFGDLIEN